MPASTAPAMDASLSGLTRSVPWPKASAARSTGVWGVVNRPSVAGIPRLGLELKPNNGLARVWYGYYYLQCAMERFEEGAAQAEQAVRIDPLSAWFRGMLATTYVPIDADTCMQVVLEALRIDPDHFLGRFIKMAALNLQGHPEEAARVAESMLAMSGRATWVMGALARTYARLGKRADAEALYMELRWRASREYVAPSVVGWAAWAAGEHDEAIRLTLAREARLHQLFHAVALRLQICAEAVAIRRVAQPPQRDRLVADAA